MEIQIEGTEPTSVTSFASEAAANEWIAKYQIRLEEGAKPKGRRSWAGRQGATGSSSPLADRRS